MKVFSLFNFIYTIFRGESESFFMVPDFLLNIFYIPYVVDYELRLLSLVCMLGRSTNLPAQREYASFYTGLLACIRLTGLLVISFTLALQWLPRPHSPLPRGGGPVGPLYFTLPLPCYAGAAVIQNEC